MGELLWLRAFIEPLNRIGVDYMVTGSVASMIAGEPRLTLDVDVVVRLQEEHIDPLIAAFPAPRFYLPPREVLLTETRRESRGHFNIIETEALTKADVYTAGRDELHAWALERTDTVQVEDLALRVAPLEYVILRKLEFHREGGSSKHLRDIASALAVSGDRVDRRWIEREITRRGLQESWAAAQP